MRRKPLIRARLAVWHTEAPYAALPTQQIMFFYLLETSGIVETQENKDGTHGNGRKSLSRADWGGLAV